MKQTKENGILYKARPEYAEKACEEIEAAIMAKEFERLALITMRESNNLHAVMLDTYPPIMYLNDTSKEIISAITDLNEQQGKIIAAYTFDAGPNANIITLEKHRKTVNEALAQIGGISELRATKIGNGPRKLGKEDSLISE
jgi:diphosphomevalonate decarboxylase